jgi:hypothetical protein
VKEAMERNNNNLIFSILNGIALLGWTFILLLLLSSTFHVESIWSILDLERVLPSPLTILYILEGICLVEVGRIALGHLKGNLLLGLVLHAIRITCLVYVLADELQLLKSDGYDDLDKQQHGIILQTALVLYSWSITEVCRYPMYLFPSSSVARNLRLLVPIVSFPVGCALEAYGAFSVVWAELFSGGITISWVKVGLLSTVILINGLLGPTLAYPAILNKGMPVLMGKQSEKNKRPKRE